MISVKDFKVGDEVIYIDFHDRMYLESAITRTGYVTCVGTKLVHVSTIKGDKRIGIPFIVDKTGLCLCTHNSRKNDLVFKSNEDFRSYNHYLALKQWIAKFDFTNLPYDKLLMIYNIVDS